jgi:hypothetical protein
MCASYTEIDAVKLMSNELQIAAQAVQYAFKNKSVTYDNVVSETDAFCWRVNTPWKFNKRTYKAVFFALRFHQGLKGWHLVVCVSEKPCQPPFAAFPFGSVSEVQGLIDQGF